MNSASFKTNIYEKSVSSLLTAALIFYAVLSFSFPVFSFDGADASGKVYCPLQKTWAKQTPVSVATNRNRNSLEDICASDRQKEFFFSAVLENLNAARISFTKTGTEAAFFKYLEKGKQSFVGAVPPENSPERHLAKASAQEKSGTSNFKIDFARYPNESFNFEQLARPPTAQEKTKFDFQFVCELKKISRSINPRSPPVFI